MVKIQLNQMPLAKLTNRFRLQTYLGATFIDDENQAFSML